MKTKSNFGLTQTEALERGRLNRERLSQLVGKISSIRDGERYPHTYIFSPPGLGKTFTVKTHLDEIGIQYYQVSGNVSMFAFGIQLAVINYLNQIRDQVVVFVDDCDEIFKTEQSLNCMKQVLSETKVFTYEKSLSSQWSNLSILQREAIKHFQDDGKMGFSVPTDNMVFVFTSNFKLPVDDEVKLAREKGQSKAVILSHKNAIRSRCKVADFDLNSAEQWGWIADVALNTECLTSMGISDHDKQTILDFMWWYWPHLTERSIRLIEKMALTMKEYPTNFKTLWEIDYIKN